MNKVEISENTFSKRLSNAYELSILHGVDSFAFMITDEQPQVQFLREYTLTPVSIGIAACLRDLEALYSEDGLLALPYRSVRIGLTSARHTLIPNRLFNPQEKSTYLEQISTLDEAMEVKSDDLNGMAAQNVYAFPKDLLSFYHRRHPTGRFCHFGSTYILASRALAAQREGYQLFIQVWPQQMLIALFHGRDLHFMNAFPYQSTKDFIYFTMLVFEQFNLDQEEAVLTLTGKILEDSEIYRTLRRYIRHVQTAPAPGYLHFGPAFANTQPYLYSDLGSLLLCS